MGWGLAQKAQLGCGHKKGRDRENGNLLSTLLCFKLKQTGELKEKKSQFIPGPRYHWEGVLMSIF